MKKLHFILVFAAALILNLTVVFGSTAVIKTRLYYDGALREYQAEAVYITINSEPLKSYSIIPVVMNSRVLVCARDVFTELGCEISWDDGSRQLCVTKGSDTIIIPVDTKTIYKNGTAVTVDAASKIINSYTMVPVRVVAEGLGCEVSFDNDERIVYINSPAEEEETEEEEVISNKTVSSETEKTAEKSKTKTVSKGSGIKILWDTISSYGANDNETKRIPIEGLDVLCPTWFAITSSGGTISDFSKKSYTE
ncbi:MAG: copper amine oxidase N-terminal domain-containing protein [Clostridiales bacterium]|nr:copper amine oxidase N-terminal domain-containing protein [Clostridiales bacterium]